MKVIGLTGGIACGKTTVANRLRKCGVPVIDADEISRSMTAKGGEALPAIREMFGVRVFNQDGTLNRKQLAAVVFQDECQRERLNAILHPMVHARILEELEQCRKAGGSIVILDVPLLFEAGLDALADFIICVSVPMETQIARLAERNGMTREQALSRIQSQWPLERKRALSDWVIDTDKPLETTGAEVEALYRSWLHAEGRGNGKENP